MAKRKPIEYTCRVMSEGETIGRTVLAQVFGAVGPIIRSDGDINLLCGGCGKVIGESVAASVLTNVVLRCTCRTYNETNLV